MGLVLEKLVNNLITVHIDENVGGQRDDDVQWIVQEVRLQSQLQLSDVLSRDSFVIKLEELFPNYERINLIELDWEKHLTISMELLEHVGVAVLEATEEDLDLLEHILFGLGWVDPLCKVVE